MYLCEEDVERICLARMFGEVLSIAANDSKDCREGCGIPRRYIQSRLEVLPLSEFSSMIQNAIDAIDAWLEHVASYASCADCMGLDFDRMGREAKDYLRELDCYDAPRSCPLLGVSTRQLVTREEEPRGQLCRVLVGFLWEAANGICPVDAAIDGIRFAWNGRKDINVNCASCHVGASIAVRELALLGFGRPGEPSSSDGGVPPPPTPPDGMVEITIRYACLESRHGSDGVSNGTVSDETLDQGRENEGSPAAQEESRGHEDYDSQDNSAEDRVVRESSQSSVGTDANDEPPMPLWWLQIVLAHGLRCIVVAKRRKGAPSLIDVERTIRIPWGYVELMRKLVLSAFPPPRFDLTVETVEEVIWYIEDPLPEPLYIHQHTNDQTSRLGAEGSSPIEEEVTFDEDLVTTTG